MAFIKLSQEFKKESYILLNSNFVIDYMPTLSNNAVKVYLLGLYFSTMDNDINTIENFSKILNFTTDEIKNAYQELEKENLIKISNLDNFEIIYLSIDNKTTKFKPIDEGKYGDFYILCQSLLTHELTQNEFKSYVDLIENYHLEPEALLMIIKYCNQSKEKGVNANYILAVAKNWIGEKIYTTKKVEEKIKEIELTSGKIIDIFKVLGLKRNATLEERDLYIKWTKVFFFTDRTILDVAETLKKKGGMKALDNKLTKYHSMQFISYDEITSYESVQSHLKTLAKTVCAKLGVYLENLEPVIDNYLNDWLLKGYSDETLSSISTYCFKNQKNSLEKMNDFINELHTNNIVSLESFKEYIKDSNNLDTEIKNLFNKLGVTNYITKRDREFYNKLINEYIVSNAMIDYAISLAKTKYEPWKYFVTVINNFNDKNIKTIEEAKKLIPNFNIEISNKTNSNLNMNTRSYSENYVNSLFDNDKEINFDD